MAICKYFLEGRCRFGNTCRFEHRQGDQPVGAFGNSNSWQSNNQRNSSKNAGNQLATLASQLTPANLQADMANNERSPWHLSCYGPLRNGPNLLNSADNLEMSFEEARMACYAASNQPGGFQEYERNMFMLIEKAKQRIRDLLNNLPAAINQLKQLCQSNDGNQTTPNNASNTFDGNTFGSNTNNPSVFGNTGSVFGNTGSTFGNTSSAFGNASGQTSAFGSTSSQQSSDSFTSTVFGSKKVTPMGGGAVFGQVSSMGNNSAFGNSAFGQANNTQSNASSAFGTMGGGTPSGATFGQSAFGNSGNTQSSNPVFGQTSTLGNSTAFGSAFGQAGSFNAAGGSAFGQTNPSQQTSAPAFGSAFGQQSAMNSAFGQGSAFNTAPANASSASFGQVATNSGGFGQNNALSMPNTNAIPSMSTANAHQQAQDTGPALTDYAKEELEAFQAHKFVFGQIPEIEPPPQLRMRH